MRQEEQREANDRLSYMTCEVRCLEKVQEKGFTDQYKANADNLVCLNNERSYNPNEICVVNYYRFEGVSDPDDMSILYAIETADGRKGTLLDAYGPYADDAIGKLMCRVANINKKSPRHGWEPTRDV